MIVLCYRNGALGHTTAALIECCTKEGGNKFPVFRQSQNLHHYTCNNNLFKIKHPDCDVLYEKSINNLVVSSSSLSSFGRCLILLMGLKKWTYDEPDANHPVYFNQFGDSYGEQLEVLALTLKDIIRHGHDWFNDANYMLDIVDYWNNVPNIITFLKLCGFTPDIPRVYQFCEQVAASNQIYFDKVSMCVDIVDKVIHNKTESFDLTFFEVAMCYAMLLDHYNIQHHNTKLLQDHPTNTQQLRSIFYD